MWWSPNSARIAFYRFDEGHVFDYYLALDQARIQDRMDIEPYVKAGATSVTATLSKSAQYRRILVHEYRGIAKTSPVDVTTAIPTLICPADGRPTCTTGDGVGEGGVNGWGLTCYLAVTNPSTDHWDHPNKQAIFVRPAHGSRVPAAPARRPPGLLRSRRVRPVVRIP